MKFFRNTAVFFVVCASAVLFLFPKTSSAIILPFGGRVVTAFVPPAICGGEGPVTIIPAGIAPPGPYAVYPATIRKTFWPIVPNAKITGLYIPVLTPICWIPVPPPGVPVPVLAFPIIMFGSSSPL